MKIEKNEILDYVLKNTNRKYHIVVTTHINSSLNLAGYSQGIIILKREYDLDNLDTMRDIWEEIGLKHEWAQPEWYEHILKIVRSVKI